MAIRRIKAPAGEVRVALWGLGRVGCALLDLIVQRQDTLASTAGIMLQPLAIADSRCAVILDKNACLQETIACKKATGRLPERVPHIFNPQDWVSWLEASRAKVLIDTSVSDFESGQPARDLYRQAMRLGFDILTANKAPLVHGLRELRKAASEAHVQLRYGATVGASLPAWDLLRIVSLESPIVQLQAVLNGTSNWILTKMEERGVGYAAALREAQELGYAEPDPERDVQGLDTAAKLLILANSFLEPPLFWQDIHIEGITRLQVDELHEARREGRGVKLVGQAARDRTGPWLLTVSPRRLSLGHPLARLQGTQKGVYLETASGGCYSLLGGASGPGPTAASLYRELLEMIEAA